MDWNSPGHAWRTSRERCAAQRRLCLEWVRTKECSWSRTQLPSGTWCIASERSAMPRGREITRCGGCIPSAGWNRWWCRMSAEVDERLDAACLYSQVPAFSASDRAMIDVLTTTRDGQTGGGRTESRRRYPPAPAGPGLLVAGGLAPRPRRVPALRIFSRAGIVERTALAVSGGAGVARASRYRHSAALHLARD